MESKYYIKIGHHITKEYYKSSQNKQLLGTGQGSGKSPFIWTLLSNKLIKIYLKNAKGAEYTDPSNTMRFTIHMTAYVDNINTHKAYQNIECLDKINQEVAKDINLWKEILHISGGKLSEDKCTYYTNKWRFSTSAHPTSEKASKGDIQINEKNSTTIVREITPQDFHKLLGLNQSIGETRRHQSDTISGKLTKILQQIREAKLDFKEIT
jgi:hypothetical protein